MARCCEGGGPRGGGGCHPALAGSRGGTGPGGGPWATGGRGDWRNDAGGDFTGRPDVLLAAASSRIRALNSSFSLVTLSMRSFDRWRSVATSA